MHTAHTKAILPTVKSDAFDKFSKICSNDSVEHSQFNLNCSQTEVAYSSCIIQPVISPLFFPVNLRPCTNVSNCTTDLSGGTPSILIGESVVSKIHECLITVQLISIGYSEVYILFFVSGVSV